MGTRHNEAVLTCTHNLYFEGKNETVLTGARNLCLSKNKKKITNLRQEIVICTTVTDKKTLLLHSARGYCHMITPSDPIHDIPQSLQLSHSSELLKLT